MSSLHNFNLCKARNYILNEKKTQIRKRKKKMKEVKKRCGGNDALLWNTIRAINRSIIHG